MQSYDYAKREGVLEIDWQQFGDLGKKLVEALAPEGVDLIVGIARAGLFPATAIACMLRRELYPVRLTRRLHDEVVYEEPVWRVRMPAAVAGQVVAVVDELADTGATLALAAQEAAAHGAARVVTASIISHSWARPKPQVVGLISDALIIFPWDREIYAGGKWQAHPELAAALAQQRPEAQHREQ